MLSEIALYRRRKERFVGDVDFAQSYSPILTSLPFTALLLFGYTIATVIYHIPPAVPKFSIENE